MGRKGEAARERIRAAARELFEQSGYTRVSMQDVCGACGLSKGGLYRHYADKAQLFADILRADQRAEDALEREGRADGVPARAILAGMLGRLRDETGKAGLQMALYEFCLENREGPGPQILKAQYARGEALLLSLIAYGTQRGEFRTDDPRGAAAAILFLTEGLRMAGAVMPAPPDVLEGVCGQIRRLLGVPRDEE